MTTTCFKAVMKPRRESGTFINSSVSMSQLWYTRRVKEKVAKQLNKKQGFDCGGCRCYSSGRGGSGG
jgi:hypothetical protein